MKDADVEAAILRLAKACNLLASAVREVEHRRQGNPTGGLLSLGVDEALSAAQNEIQTVADLVERAKHG